MTVDGNDRLADLRRRLDLRPLGARSIVLSVLLGNHPPAMNVGTLVRFAQLFDIAPGTLRTALSRMVGAGELDNEGGTYRLTGRMLGRQVEQDLGLEAPPDAWDGTWWTATVTAERRDVADRRSFRAAMVAARMGELRPDTWLRPANLPTPLTTDDMVLLRGDLASGSGRSLAKRLWDLDGIGQRARELTRALVDVSAGLEEEPATSVAPTFVVSAACVRFLRVEPKLPEALQPDRSTAELRAAYAERNRAFRSALRAVVRSEA